MDTHYTEIKRALDTLLAEEDLRRRLHVGGGVLPWLLTGENSGRLHGDVDLSAEAGFDALMTATVEEECSGREKDRADLRQLEKLDFDTARYVRVKGPGRPSRGNPSFW